MTRRVFSEEAQSMIEYVTLIALVLGALVVMGNYIIHGLTGKWKATGSSFGFGLHFIPKNTIECRYDVYAGTGRWYDDNCFDNNNCDCFSLQQNSETCRDCILNCTRSECD